MFTPELAESICRSLAQGSTLRKIHRSAENMPAPSTIMDWVRERPEFAEQYAQARATGYQLMADEIIEISDDAEHDRDEKGNINSEVVARSRLRVDSRKWMLAKMLPKIYGERVDVAHSGAVQFSRIESVIVDPQNAAD